MSEPIADDIAAGLKAVKIDIRGQICPSALLLALKNLNSQAADLKKGACCIQILTDAREATSTIPQAVENMGFKVQVMREKQYYCLTIYYL